MKTTIQFKQLAGNGCRCRHMIQQDFADIKGVYGLHSDMINSTVLIEHTEEVTYPQLIARLEEMGYEIVKPEYHIRKATEEDMEALSVLSQDVMRNNYSAFLGESTVEDYISSGVADKEIEENVLTISVLTASEQEDQGDDILAYAIQKEDLIHMLMVRVGCQHQGIGSYLLQHVMDKMLKEYNTLRIETFANNIPAIGCYEKMGWQRQAIKEVPEMGLTLIEMSYTSL